MADLTTTTLGPYRILEQIGLGGMATVYKAYQPGMDRLVALKVLPQHYARDPRFIKRFEQEARVIAKLEHRNIVPVYDFGEQDGTAYLAMRYLQAGTVKEILSHGPLPLPDAAKLLSDIASALDYAHSQGIIHRDVKPSNVLVDKQGNAYLTDFGIAKVIESTMEMTGSAALGTPAYMAPEQTLGKAVTPQSDVYSLGVMLYEMVTGKPPFEADTPMAIALMHVHEPLPLPRKVKPELPEAVEMVILKALAKEPKDRYLRAGDAAKAFTETTRDNIYGASTRLVELANEAAKGKGSEEITYDIREEIRMRGRAERTKQLMRWFPYAIGCIAVIALMALVIWLSGQIGGATAAVEATAQSVSNTAQVATHAAAGPTDTATITSTPDLNLIATQLRAVTETHGAEESATRSIALTQAQETQWAEQTIIALTPSNTPTLTLTPSPTVVPSPTLTPKWIYSSSVLLGPGGCTPNSVWYGLVVIDDDIGGGWDTAELARLAVGDTVPTFTVNGQPVRLKSFTGPNLAVTTWAYHASIEVILQPGAYEIVFDWNSPTIHWINTCTLNVTTP